MLLFIYEREVTNMNTILIIIIIYLLVTFGFCFINTLFCDCPNDTEELIINLFWIICLPWAFTHKER